MAETQSQPRYPRRPGFTGAAAPAAAAAAPVAVKQRQFIERKAPELFSFLAVGDVLEGTLLRIDGVVIEDKSTRQKKRVSQYTMRKENGDVVKFLGTYDLDCKLFQSDVGHFMEIIYVGENKEVKRGNNYMRIFKVNIEDSGAVPRAAESTEITDADIPF